MAGYGNKGGGSRSGYPSNQSKQNTQSGGSGKKNNGCKKSEKDGKSFITGWNNSKDRGFVSVLIAPYSGSHEVKSKTGKTFMVLMAKIQYKNSGVEDHYPVLYCNETGYVTLKKHGWVLNPKKGNMTRL